MITAPAQKIGKPYHQFSTCHPRRRFSSKESAAAAARNIAANNGQHRLPEPCSKCNGWHLSGVQP